MKSFYYLFQRRMVIVLFLIYILMNLLTHFKSIGVNKTVGWAFDLSYFSLSIFSFSFYVFLLAYGILALTKKETNMTFSVVHVIIICLSIILLEKAQLDLLMMFNCLSIVVFLINMFKSLKTLNQSAHNSGYQL